MKPVTKPSWAEVFQTQPLIPVWAQTNLEQALDVAQALKSAGYSYLEITLRQEASWQCLEALQTSGLKLIAGSLRNLDQLKRLQELNSNLEKNRINHAVSPGWCALLAQNAVQAGLEFLPGIATPSEAMQASNLGFKQQKLFPAQALGGPAYLAALSAPLPELEFMVTGGLSPQNLAAWLQVPAVKAIGGSWMLTPELTAAPKKLQAVAAEALELVK